MVWRRLDSRALHGSGVKENKMRYQKLKNKTYVTQIMPQTNRPICEYYLVSGTPVRNICVVLVEEPMVFFDANPDGTWFRYHTFGKLELEP